MPRRLVFDFGALRAVSCILADADRTYAEVPVPEILPSESFIVRDENGVIPAKKYDLEIKDGKLFVNLSHGMAILLR